MVDLRTLIASAMMGVALFGGLAAAPAAAQGRSDQRAARAEMRAGNQLSLREIEQRVLPVMRGHQYLGPAYDAEAMAYRLKFIRDGRVTFIDVDARSGRIIGRSG